MKAIIALGAVVGLLLLLFRGAAPPTTISPKAAPTGGALGMCLPLGREV